MSALFNRCLMLRLWFWRQLEVGGKYTLLITRFLILIDKTSRWGSLLAGRLKARKCMLSWIKKARSPPLSFFLSFLKKLYFGVLGVLSQGRSLVSCIVAMKMFFLP